MPTPTPASPPPISSITPSTNPAAGDADAPPERLTLAFHTADVVVLGARLGRLAELIGSHELAAIIAIDERYANAEAAHPWVAKIIITWLGKP